MQEAGLHQAIDKTGILPLPGEMVHLAQRGCHSAFEALARAYSQRLFKQILSITRHHEDAEDALQDTLCRAYVALPSFEHRCHVYTWLSRIAINCALMRVRKRQSYKEISMDGDEGREGGEAVFELPAWGWSPEELCRAKERLEQIFNVAESLDPLSRYVLHLRADQEYSMQEIAGILDISVAAAKARLYRARHELRVFLPAALLRELAEQ